MSDITIWDEDLAEGLDELEGRVRQLSKKSGGAKQELIADCDRQITHVQSMKKSYNIELRQLPREQQELYKQKLAEYQERLQEAMREVAYAKSSGQRQELMAGAQPTGAAAPNQLTNDQLAAKTSEVHDKIDESLDRQMRKLEETKAVAVNTAGALVSQTEQMGRIANEVDRMEEGLQRADKLLAAFARRIFTDRIIQVFLFLVVVGLAIIIILAVVLEDNAPFNVPDEMKPPNPTTLT